MTTALSYGLSQYALEMLVRVLVLELIPLTAALFVALRCTIPSGAELARLRFRGEFEAQRALRVDPLRRELMPRVVAGIVSVLLLAEVSCVIALVLPTCGANRWRRMRGTPGARLPRDRGRPLHPRCAPMIASFFAPPFESSGANP